MTIESDWLSYILFQKDIERGIHWWDIGGTYIFKYEKFTLISK